MYSVVHRASLAGQKKSNSTSSLQDWGECTLSCRLLWKTVSVYRRTAALGFMGLDGGDSALFNRTRPKSTRGLDLNLNDLY